MFINSLILQNINNPKLITFICTGIYTYPNGFWNVWQIQFLPLRFSSRIWHGHHNLQSQWSQIYNNNKNLKNIWWHFFIAFLKIKTTIILKYAHAINFPLYIMMYIFKLNIEIALCIHNVINSNYEYKEARKYLLGCFFFLLSIFKT